MVVDLPAPFGPRNPVTLPVSTSKDKLFTAVFFAIFFAKIFGFNHLRSNYSLTDC